MKTDNFNMDFIDQDDDRYTLYTFGFSSVSIWLESDPLSLDERFKLVYRNQGVLKLSVSTSQLPGFISYQIKLLYYGFLDYTFVYRKRDFLACQVLSVVRTVFNYLRREKIPFC